MNINHTKALSYAGAVFLSILSICAIVLMITLIPRNNSYEDNTITVTGKAELTAQPDIASLSFTVREVADTAEEAQTVVSEKTNMILSGFEMFDIEDNDIRTDAYTINPEYQWVRVDQVQQESPEGVMYYPGQDRERVLVGYEVRQQVNLTLRSLDTAPEILSLLAESEVENLYGPNFEIEDPDALQEEVRSEAIQEAQEKAQRLADNLGVRLGKVVSFNEGNPSWYPMYARNNVMMESASFDGEVQPSIPAGENEVVSQVTIVYTIK